MPLLHLRTILHRRSKGCLDAMPSIQYARVRFNSGNRSSDALAATRCAIRCVLRASRRIDRSSILRKCLFTMMLSRVDVRCRSAPPHALPSRGALWNECLITSSHTVEKSLFFARRVTLGSSEIRFIVVIVRCGPVVDRRLRWRVVGTNNSVPPVCVMHRSRVRRATQGDQKAQGQNRTHRFFSNRPRSYPVRSQQARAIFIRLGDNNADCFVSPARSHQRNMG
jgi:hypothetical protein